MIPEIPFQTVLIPVRFYGFDSVMYLISALIGFAVSSYAFKLFELTEKKFHFYLYLGFTVLSMGLLTIGITSGYVYLNFFLNKEYIAFDPVAMVDDLGYWIYYIASLIGYGLLVLIYLPEKAKFFPVLVPLWYKGFAYFQVIAFFLLSYVVFRSIVNFWMKKSFNTFLVMFSFSAIAAYHLLLFFTVFGKIMYVIAHFSLLFGFLALLLMLIRVSKK